MENEAKEIEQLKAFPFALEAGVSTFQTACSGHFRNGQNSLKLVIYIEDYRGNYYGAC